MIKIGLNDFTKRLGRKLEFRIKRRKFQKIDYNIGFEDNRGKVPYCGGRLLPVRGEKAIWKRGLHMCH
jgi:hypothetical protein